MTSLRFLIDAQLPPALSTWLKANGHSAEHVFEHGMANADDAQIWELACKTDAVLMTKDEDYVLIRQRTANGPAVIWLRLGNATNARLLNWLAPLWPSVEAAISAGNTIVEVR